MRVHMAEKMRVLDFVGELASFGRPVLLLLQQQRQRVGHSSVAANGRWSAAASSATDTGNLRSWTSDCYVDGVARRRMRRFGPVRVRDETAAGPTTSACSGAGVTTSTVTETMGVASPPSTRIGRPSKHGFRPSLLLHIVMLFLFLMPFAHCYPLGRRSKSSGDLITAMGYLSRYGYLPTSDVETGNLRTEKQVREAIKNMQRFGNISQTGELDEPTLQLMKRKRCGNLDVNQDWSFRAKRYTLQGVKWDKVDLTWRVATYTRSLGKDTVRREISNAFKIWSDASKLTFTEVSSEDADIVVSFNRRYHGDGYPFDGQGAVLAHAFFPGVDRGGDTHFDDEEVWIAGVHNSDEGVSLLSVAAHEFGHSLGLSHSAVPDALMFPYYQGLKKDFKLPYDDVMGIQQLYGPKKDRPWAPILPTMWPPYVEPTTTSTPRPTTPHGAVTPAVATARPPTRESLPNIPNTCDTSYDAISSIRNEIFIFKDRYFWRLDDGGLRQDYPVEIDRFWYNLPASTKRVDALYERPKDQRIIFFIGKQYWIFDENKALPGYPKPLTDLGIPDDIEKIDAAMVWGHNKKTYLFSGTMYWRFDENEQRVELDYPRDMTIWKGVPYNIDAAFQWNGTTYFFKGKTFWKFDDKRMKVVSKTPSLSGPFWMACPDDKVEKIAPEEDRKEIVHSAAKTSMTYAVTGGATMSRTTVGLKLLVLSGLLVMFMKK